MNQQEECVLVYVTAPDAECATMLARTLVSEHLVAGVNIVPGMNSVYRWRGKICEAPEYGLWAQTVRARFAAVRDRIRALHPYEVPCIIALPVSEGHDTYLNWIVEETAVPSGK